jgi:hypothetical protein
MPAANDEMVREIIALAREALALAREYAGAGGCTDAGEGAAPDGHSDDFRRVTRGGVSYELSPKRAAVVAALYDAEQALARGEGDGTRSQADLLRIAESDCQRLHDLFRGSAAWNTLVVSDGRGNFRLAGGGPGE